MLGLVMAKVSFDFSTWNSSGSRVRSFPFFPRFLSNPVIRHAPHFLLSFPLSLQKISVNLSCLAVLLFPILAHSITKTELDSLVLHDFQLNNEPLDSALAKWKASVGVASGEPKKNLGSLGIDFRRTSSLFDKAGPDFKVPITLSFRYVLAGECLRRIVERANATAQICYFEVSWYSETGFSINLKESSRGLQKARKIMLKSFEIEDASIGNIVEAWSDAVEKAAGSGPGKIYFVLTTEYEGQKQMIPAKLELKMSNMSAVETLNQICWATGTAANWDNFQGINGQSWDVEIKGNDRLVQNQTPLPWKNSEGKEITATFVAVTETAVVLKMPTGSKVEVPLEKLSRPSLIQALKKVSR